MSGRATWPLALAVVSAAALLAAVYVEHVMQIAPCELCLVERWPWRVALAASIAALVLVRARPALRAVALLALAASAVLGAVHAGVEWHWWPSPFPSCRARLVGGGSLADQLAALPARAAKPCDAATFLLPGVPVSMAVANLLLSLVTFVLVLGLRPRPHQDPAGPGPGIR